MYRRRKAAGFNRAVMLGVMATAVVVLAVAVAFWIWCFPDGTKDYNALAPYHISLTDDFAGDSIIIAVNDSIIVNQTVNDDSLALSLSLPADQTNLLMITLAASGDTYAFDLPKGGGSLILNKAHGAVSARTTP